MPIPPATPLPSGYLLQNFRHVLTWVKNLYEDLLTAAELDFFQRFDALPPPAQSLYVRLVTRKGPLIPLTKLQYAEIPSTATALAQLDAAGFARCNAVADSTSLLALLTKPQLLALFATAAPALRANLPRAALLDQITDCLNESQIHAAVAAHCPYVEAVHGEIFSRFLLLFFGNQHQDLSEFVVTGLGHVRYEPYSICKQTRYFNSRAELEILQQYLAAREQLDSAEILSDVGQLEQLFRQLPCHQQLPELQRRYQHITLDLARQLERLQQPQSALKLYRHCTQHPARERQARILARQGDTQTALALCRDILADSIHPQELEFAAAFGAALAKKTGAEFPRTPSAAITTFHLDLPASEAPVELIAAAALSDDQHDCLYVENQLFCSLFGLYFWDIIFAPLPGAFFHPFQRGPKHLRSEFFYADRRDALQQRLARLQQHDWQQILWQHFQQKQGIANHFVHWEWLTPTLIERTLQAVPAAHLQFIFHQLCQHPGLYTSGFPDLIRFSPQGYELIEVKGPGDRLQPHQRRWFGRFRQAGIPARLLTVSWLDQAND